jgi:hypothetical protein
MVFDNADSTIQLLAKNQSGHGMRQGQAGQPDGFIGALL